MYFMYACQGLKTGMYYLRTRPAANAIQFTVDHGVIQQVKDKKEPTSNGFKEQEGNEYDDREQAVSCSLQNKEACIMCSA